MIDFARSIRQTGMLFLLFAGILLTIRLFFAHSGQISGFSPSPTQAFLVRATDYFLLLLVLFMVLLIAMAVFWAAYLFAKWIVTSVGAGVVSSATTGGRLAGAVATAIMFGDVVSQVFRQAAQILLSVFSRVYSGLVSSFQDGLICIEDAPLISGESFSIDLSNRCLIQMLSNSGRSVSSIAEEVFGRGFMSVSPTQFLLALGSFVIVSRLASLVQFDLDQRAKFWAGYAAVAGFSIFLSLSALLAVPLLEGESTSTATPTSEFRSGLEVMVQSQLGDKNDSSAESIAQNTPDDDLSKEVSGDKSLEPVKAAAEAVDEAINAARLIRSQFISRGRGHVNSQLEVAFNAYSAEAGVRRGEREARRHVLDLRSWLQREIDAYKQELSVCDGFIGDLVNRRAELVNTAREIKEVKPDQDADAMTDFLFEVSSVREMANRADSSCSASFYASSLPPTRADYGSFLGIAGVAASWLLATESMQVTLLTGLIGFGLLGALVAFFVRTPEKAREANALDIAILVFTGFCAAIVVYVASYGGLAIASTSSDDPNPYVVFFACLVGAIYSGDIFSKAKEVLFKP